MHVLLVEDRPSVIEIFQLACEREGVRLSVATSLSGAEAVLDKGRINADLAVCDLKIPTSHGGVDEEVAHGLSVLRRLQEECPGVPVIVLSAFGTVDVVSDMLLGARQVDLYGDGSERPMLRFWQKANIKGVIQAIGEANEQLRQIDQVELYAPDLSDAYRRAIRLFARRRAGSVVEYRGLAGGRSGAQTGLVTVRSQGGAQTAHAVGKLTTVSRAVEEKERYRNHIAGRLAAATYTDLSDEVMAGCGSSAGLFYSVADNFGRDIFSVLREDEQAAGAVVRTVSEVFSPWLNGVPWSDRSWLDLRRNLIADEDYEDVTRAYDVVAIHGERRVQTVWTSQHGDLHGANVLVDDSLRPVLIDYGRVGFGPSPLDAVTLELSAFMHPDSPFRHHDWPSAQDLSRWSDLEAYLAGCPYPTFVRACREWALKVRVGQRDLYCTICAFSLRNLQYGDVDKEKVLALQQYAAAQVNAS
ncbi:response regulator [Humibacillus xanthopallidus]|uniref:response regulator n=1 Tax=Humibacillus xanthopallidus TaxID=412689 RepID=UPI00384D3D90